MGDRREGHPGASEQGAEGARTSGMAPIEAAGSLLKCARSQFEQLAAAEQTATSGLSSQQACELPRVIDLSSPQLTIDGSRTGSKRLAAEDDWEGNRFWQLAAQDDALDCPPKQPAASQGTFRAHHELPAAGGMVSTQLTARTRGEHAPARAPTSLLGA